LWTFFFSQKITIEGGVNDVFIIGSGSVSEAGDFYIHYTSYDLMFPTLTILVVIIIIGIIYIIYKRKRPLKIAKYMYCKKCKKRFKKSKFCPECGEKLAEKKEMEISL